MLRKVRRNVIFCLTVITVCLMSGLLLFAQFYVNNAYQRSLSEQILEVETASLDIAAQNLYAQFKPYLNVLYGLATDADVYQCAREGQRAGAPSAYVTALLRDMFRNDLLPMNEIVDISLIYRDGTQIRYTKDTESYSNYLRIAGSEQTRQALYQSVRGSKVPVVRHEDYLGEPSIRVAVPLIGTFGSRETMFAILAGTIRLDFLKSLFLEIDTANVRNYLLDSECRVILCTDKSKLGTVLKDTAEANTDVMEAAVNRIGWRLVKRIDRSGMLLEMTQLSNNINLMYILLLIALTIGIALAAYRLLRPLRTLTQVMRKAGEGDLLARQTVRGDNEVWDVVAHFNAMMDKLCALYGANERYYKQALEAEKRHRKAEMEVLESHINAHFLYNSLSAISFEALQGGNRSVSVSLKHLANIMRYAFSNRSECVMLCQETAWVEQYLYMQKERLGERLSYDVSIEDDAANWPLRKMMLQPFVENAILHGMEGVPSCVILVRAGLKDARHALISISDNGCGMDAQTLRNVDRVLRDPASAPEGGVGLRNVAERIYTFFGPDAEILVASAPGAGSSFTLILPVPIHIRENPDSISEESKEDEEDAIY